MELLTDSPHEGDIDELRAHPAGPSDDVDQIPRRRLPFWVALALSVALVGPTLAMSGNGQGLIGTVGKSIPLVFLIGLVGVSLVGYSFVRLTRHLNHAGSAYGLVGRHHRAEDGILLRLRDARRLRGLSPSAPWR